MNTYTKYCPNVFVAKCTEPQKSTACKQVLYLMDEGFTYSEALESALDNNKDVDKINLEIELNKYI